MVAVGAPLDINPKKGVTTDLAGRDSITSSSLFDPKIDLRGMTVLDAQQVLQTFMDNAVLSSANTLRIVHGKVMAF
ncbi:MAG: Smr/MutS family protein [Saprospiraceae bacterium]|nr:Smr/MutS family protein [Saprospiraceae bacterium]